jgi:hypothetical protein
MVRKTGDSIYYYNETLDHLPSSCIVTMAHVVKGRQYSAYTGQCHGMAASELQRYIYGV